MRGTFDGLGRVADPWLLVLTSLAEGPKQGYAIMADAAAFSGVRMEPGTLYRALSRLKRRGRVTPAATTGRPLDWRAEGTHLIIPLVFPLQELAVLRLQHPQLG